MPLPPGSMGLPLVGETPTFLRNMYRFLEVRQQRHGPVFKSNVLGRRIVFLSGTARAEAFYAPGNVSRADAHPFPLVDLFGGVNMEMKDASIYTDPDRFDADRFSPERAEHKKHPMAFIPQGAEPPTGHRCLGLDYATVLGVAFVALLVRGYEWTLPPQDLSWNWAPLPPEPRDRLRMQMSARTPARNPASTPPSSHNRPGS